MKRSSGFTLIETLISALILSLISISIYSSFVEVTKGIRAVRVKQNAASLANEQFEIIRNLAYNDVGIIGGIPVGILQREKTITRDGLDFEVTTTIRSVDQEFDGTVDEGDLSPADTKFVQIDIVCENCGDNLNHFFYASQVAPKNLETGEGNGALFVQVFDATGQPITDANIHIENNSLDPTISIDEVSNINGLLQIVDAPPANGSYEITVTKPGYSTERTYAIGDAGNPSPNTPHANVIEGSVTQLSFAIDKVSDLEIVTTDNLCQSIGNIDFDIRGSKTIGPDLYKYSEAFTTNGSGVVNVDDIEWDTYNVALSDAGYHLAGSNPTLPLALNPGSNQSLNLVLTPKESKGLLIQVVDAGTGLPLSNADITIDNGSSTASETTGLGFITQTDWSGGGGQTDYVDDSRFFSETDMEFNAFPGEIKLDSFGSSFASSGELTSSIFDMGTIANLHTLTWLPGDAAQAQAGPSPVRFQIASNDVLVDPETLIAKPWNYKGPDGTSSSYYESSGESLGSTHDGVQFFRYKVLLSTTDTSFSPAISDISFTFSSDCVPSGEVLFQSLVTDDYDISVSRSGYQSQTVANYSVDEDFQVLRIILSQ